METEAKGDGLAAATWPVNMGSPGFFSGLFAAIGSHPSTFPAVSPHLIKQVPTEGCTVRACLR